jgi:pSer/pThr/pTyr-binding forkhead associated (FHA) protein
MPLLVIKKKNREIRRFTFAGDCITIGRDSRDSSDSPDLILADPSRKVSRYHAAVVRAADGEYFIRDLASANGTFVNDKITYGRRLKDGQRITIGDFDLIYSEHEKTPIDLSPAIRIVTAAPDE